MYTGPTSSGILPRRRHQRRRRDQETRGPCRRGFISAAPTRDVTTVATDPGDFNHMLIGSHSIWPGKTNGGILETGDAATFIIHQPIPAFNAGGMGIAFLHDLAHGLRDANTWLVSTDGGDLWTAADSGAHFTEVASTSSQGLAFGVTHGGNQIDYASNGFLYIGRALRIAAGCAQEVGRGHRNTSKTDTKTDTNNNARGGTGR
jgi:hypothetical protein